MSRIVLGVGGGIAAYKACTLIRLLTAAGHRVDAVPTESALRFVGEATLEALSGNAVSTSVFTAVEEVRHVRLGQEADLLLIAPATADLLARLAAGRADDLLTATALMHAGPVLLAPAMHTEMWRHPATRANIATLRERGVVVLEPAHGRLTGPDEGPGRLPEPEAIAELAGLVLDAGPGVLRRDLDGRRVLVTAGGTREAIDPVRFLGNASSGRQGRAVAEVAAQRGAQVHLVLAAAEPAPDPAGAEITRVRDAREMLDAVLAAAGGADLALLAAAVADYRPAREAGTKLKKGADDAALHQLELVENPDILRTLVERRAAGEPAPRRIIGFAAETGAPGRGPLELGREKLARKGCDAIFLNDVSGGRTFGRDGNEGWILAPGGGEIPVPHGSKHAVAARILDHAAGLLD